MEKHSNLKSFYLPEKKLLLVVRDVEDLCLSRLLILCHCWLVKQMQDSQDWKLFNGILTPISDEKEEPMRIGKVKVSADAAAITLLDIFRGMLPIKSKVQVIRSHPNYKGCVLSPQIQTSTLKYFPSWM